AGSSAYIAIESWLEREHHHQVGERFRPHLAHDAGSMLFHCFLGRSKLSSYPFVQQTRRDQDKNFALARRQSFVSFQFTNFTRFRPHSVRTLDSVTDSVQ